MDSRQHTPDLAFYQKALDAEKQKTAELSHALDRAQQRLLEHAALNTIIKEQTLFAMHIIQDGRFVYLSDLTVELTGYSRREMMHWGPGEFQKVA